ncbi:MAG: hypothetical protein LH645_14280 [Actinomycetia bacterium]|nr:hypothetical protein [Actinomycetes bacterium]
MTASHQARATAVAAKGPIGDLGGNWMMGEAEEQATAAAGMVDWQLYFLGRHGVLGDVDTDVILAAAFFFPPDHLRREWGTARALMTPEEGLGRYLAVCHQWGRERLAGLADVDRLSELGVKVIDASGVVGLPLFAGWRAVPLPHSGPTTGAERCAQVMQVLREHRGACHGVALASLQLDPLVAVLANQGGEQNAVEYGWQPPFAKVTEADRVLRERVEELTDDLVAVAYDGLSVGEQAELGELLEAAHTHVFK